MAEGGADNTAQLITWVVAGLGIGINLLWNIANRRHTNKTAKAIRAEQHQIDRWARLRSRMETKLSELVESLRNAPLHYANLDPAKVHSTAPMVVLNIGIVNAHDDLSRVLGEADRADFCESCEWAQLAYGAQYDSETSWDLAMTVLETAARYNIDRVKHLGRLKDYAADIEHAVRTAIDQQDATMSPESK